MNPGLNQLINTVSTLIMSAAPSGGCPTDLGAPSLPPQAFDLFDGRLGGGAPSAFHMGKQPPQQQHFGSRGQNPGPPSPEVLSQLLMRESHLQATIIQLDKKKRVRVARGC